MGPLTGATLWFAQFSIEIILWCFFSAFLYSFLFKYLLTRYLIAYPGVILSWNLIGWIVCLCLWFIYTVLKVTYDFFFSDGPRPSSESYYDSLDIIFIISTITVTLFAFVFIYNQERGYWDSKKS